MFILLDFQLVGYSKQVHCIGYISWLHAAGLFVEFDVDWLML
jgi:hypothetical protein